MMVRGIVENVQRNVSTRQEKAKANSVFHIYMFAKELRF